MVGIVGGVSATYTAIRNIVQNDFSAPCYIQRQWKEDVLLIWFLYIIVELLSKYKNNHIRTFTSSVVINILGGCQNTIDKKTWRKDFSNISKCLTCWGCLGIEMSFKF